MNAAVEVADGYGKNVNGNGTLRFVCVQKRLRTRRILSKRNMSRGLMLIDWDKSFSTDYGWGLVVPLEFLPDISQNKLTIAAAIEIRDINKLRVGAVNLAGLARYLSCSSLNDVSGQMEEIALSAVQRNRTDMETVWSELGAAFRQLEAIVENVTSEIENKDNADLISFDWEGAMTVYSGDFAFALEICHAFKTELERAEQHIQNGFNQRYLSRIREWSQKIKCSAQVSGLSKPLERLSERIAVMSKPLNQEGDFTEVFSEFESLFQAWQSRKLAFIQGLREHQTNVATGAAEADGELTHREKWVPPP